MSAHTEALKQAREALIDAYASVCYASTPSHPRYETLDRISAARQQIDAALSLPDPGAAPVVPQGWKLVPEEPTPEMLSAAENAGAPDGEDGLYWPFRADEQGIAYAAMLAAAPPAPHQEQAGQEGAQQ